MIYTYTACENSYTVPPTVSAFSMNDHNDTVIINTFKYSILYIGINNCEKY